MTTNQGNYNVSSSSSVGTAPPVYRNVLSGSKLFECGLTGTHAIDKKEVVRYLDGVTIGHCMHCGDRIAIPLIEGGGDVVELRELAARLLVDSSDWELRVAHRTKFDQVVRDRDMMNKAIAESSAVLQVLKSRQDCDDHQDH